MVKQKDVHKLFKQAMISRRYASEDLAAILWKKCEDACRTINEDIEPQFSREEVATYINEINDTIIPLSIEFKSRLDEVSGKRFWALVNTVDGEIAQLATEYTPTEIQFFKQLIDLIILAPADAFSVSSLAAIREVSNMKATMTKTQADAALQSFVSNGWLYKSERGRYALSTRSLIELELYLRRTFEGDVPECMHCTELCTLGYTCNKNDVGADFEDEDGEATCKMSLHRHCYSILRRNATATSPLKCPACGRDWSTAGGDEGDRTKSRGKGKEAGLGLRQMGEWSVPDGYEDAFRRRKKRSTAVSEEEDELDDQGDGEAPGVANVVDAVVEEEELESDPPTPPRAIPKQGTAPRKQLASKVASKKA